MATATLRAILVTAALVVGVFVLSRAFPQTQSATAPVAQPTTAAPEETAAPMTEPETTTPPPASPDVRGVRLAVLNGTSEAGLAAATAQELQKLGYLVNRENIGDAQNKPYETTTLFFRPNSRPEARYLRDTVFNGAKLEPAGQGFSPDVRITVVLGLDWAETH